MNSLTCEEQLDIISRAWGLQDGGGYVFFPWIRGDAKNKEERVKGYHEGPGFRWPEDKADIIAHLEAHTDDDVYWCPNMFEKHFRKREFAMDEHALWADLDDVDPRGLDEFKPTIAWQTSADHYQALWVTRRPMLGASWPGEENQKLTYYLGADSNGWDSTQLLRIPGWGNHKPERRKGTQAFPGKLLWANGPRYSRHQFESLPDVKGRTDAVREVLGSDIDAVDTAAVMARVRLKLGKRVREFLTARELPNKGKRSEILWEIERDLADAGCTLAEIIAIVKKSVWNKYAGRSDELLRLSTEASRALDEVDESSSAVIEIERPETTPRIESVLANISPPKWLIRDIWTQGSCGFVAGEPKTWKSWFTLDMALAISTGSPFLGAFDIVEPGPVLYIQEEDPAQRLKVRYGKVWESRADWRVELSRDGKPMAVPGHQITRDPDIGLHIKCGILLSDEAWQEWLRDRINEGLNGHPYRAVILDPLIYMLGDVDENKSGPMMNRVLKPLKVIAEEFGVAIIVIHHMRKSSDKTKLRGGQMMLGSVATHAWTEDGLYMTRNGNEVIVEVESKTAVGGSFKVTGLKNRRWTPTPYDLDLADDELTPPDERPDVEVRQSHNQAKQQARKDGWLGTRGRVPKAIDSIVKLQSATVTQVAKHAGITRQSADNQLKRAVDRGAPLTYNPNTKVWAVNGSANSL